MASVKLSLSWRHLATEAGLFLLISYLVLFGGTFNGVILYEFNLINFIGVLVLGCAWLTWRFWRGRPFPATPLDKPLLVFAAACLLVTALSVDPRRSAITLVQLIFYILLFYCLVDFLRAGLDADLLTKVWLLSSLVVMLFSILQIIFWYKSWIDLAGWRHPVPSTTIRISAFLGHPNIMAAYLNLLLPLGIGRAVQSRSRAGKVGWSIWAILVTGLIFFTSSRGGWFGTAGVFGILAILWVVIKWATLKSWLGGLRWRKWFMAGLVIALAAAGAAGYGLLNWQSKNPTHASSGLDFMSRSYIWQVAWQTFSTHPLFGNGPYTFGTQFIQSISVPPSMLLGHAHNLLFNVASEAGIVGVAAFGWVIVSFLIFAWKTWKTADAGRRRVLASLFASLGGLSIHSLFDTPELLPLIGIMIVVFTALVISRGEVETGSFGRQPASSVELAPKKRKKTLLWNVVLTLVWLILTIIIGWGVWAYRPASQGAAAANSGDWTSAAGDFDLAITRDPRMAFNWLQAGFAQGQLALAPDGSLKDARNLALAVNDYQHGIALEPVYGTNWANLGLLEWARGLNSAAIADMKKAAAVAPSQLAFKLTYGRMLEMDRQPDEARIIYRQVLDVSPSWASTYFFRATPLRMDLVKKWRSELNLPENTYSVGNSPASIEISGFSLADNGSVAYNKLALGVSLTQHGDLKGAVAAIQSGVDLLSQTTSFGIGQMGDSPYGWSIFNRESIAADLLPGLDYPLYPDDVVRAMLVLADDYQKLGDQPSALKVYEKILQVAPDCQDAINKIR